MNDIKQKRETKSVRAGARKAIEIKLVADLKTIAKKFGQDVLAMEKVLEKESKKLAKRVAKEFVATGVVVKHVEKKINEAKVKVDATDAKEQ